jgi:hypothetical protein
MEYRLKLAGGDGARKVGGLVEQALRAWDIHDPGANLLLVATELIENVYQHTPGGGELSMTLQSGTILIMVFDTSQVLPELQDPHPGVATGRGLRLVRTVAKDWGAHPQPTGKVVWAEIALTAGANSGSPTGRSLVTTVSEPAQADPPEPF